MDLHSANQVGTPKMPGEPPRVQPSKQRYDDENYQKSEGGYLRDNPEEPPGGWESARQRRSSRGPAKPKKDEG